jgi:Restriction endonuclease
MPTAPRHIFDAQPRTWQDLEHFVEQAFAEMGYESHRDHELVTVRGKVKIDVYAVKQSTPIPTVVLCECKHWAKAVEQSVVHGFRSVCSDVGAHFGLIISKAGFQSGASETRESTSIHLLDFNAFQETYFEEWRTGIVMKFAQMTDVLTPLFRSRYTSKDPVLESKLEGVNPLLKYGMFFGEPRFSAYFIEHNDLPVEVVDPRGDPKDIKRITVASYREYFEIASQGATDARKHFSI